MTSSRKKVTKPYAPAKKATKGTETPAPPSGLIPSAEQLRRAVAGAAMDMSAQSEGDPRDRPGSLDVPRALLNPLESLPRPLTLDEVKDRVRATANAPPFALDEVKERVRAAATARLKQSE